ncbi:GNAT family N-acetyltransferase [Verrucomicrobiota bacterium]
MKPDRNPIRPAAFKDAEAIFGLVKAYPAELLPRPMGDIVQNIDRFLVCAAGRRVVGTVAWHILPEIGAPSQPSVEIKSLAVLDSHRGQGIGRRLVTEAVAHVRPLNPSQILVLTFVPGFFRKLGFRRIAKEKLMHKLYMGCINCSKYDSPFTCPEQAMVLKTGPRRP